MSELNALVVFNLHKQLFEIKYLNNTFSQSHPVWVIPDLVLINKIINLKAREDFFFKTLKKSDIYDFIELSWKLFGNRIFFPHFTFRFDIELKYTPTNMHTHII